MNNSLYYPVICLQCIWLWIIPLLSCYLSAVYLAMNNSLYYPVICLQCIWLWITCVWSCCLSSGYRGIQHDPVQAAVDGRLRVPILGARHGLGDRCAVHRLYTGRHGPRSDQGKREKPVAGKGVGSVRVSLLRNEGNVLFNDALNTFYLRLCYLWTYG